MIDFLYQYGMFLAQVVTLVVAILVVIGGIVSAAARNRHRTSRDGELRVKHLNEEFDDLRESIVDQVLPEAERKAEHKKKRTLVANGRECEVNGAGGFIKHGAQAIVATRVGEGEHSQPLGFIGGDRHEIQVHRHRDHTVTIRTGAQFNRFHF